MFMQARQSLEQRPDKFLAQAQRRPVLELTEIEDVADDPEVGEYIGAHVHIRTDDFHYFLSCLALFRRGLSRRHFKASARNQNMQPDADQADRLAATSLVH